MKKQEQNLLTNILKNDYGIIAVNYHFKMSHSPIKYFDNGYVTLMKAACYYNHNNKVITVDDLHKNQSNYFCYIDKAVPKKCESCTIMFDNYSNKRFNFIFKYYESYLIRDLN